MSSFNEPLFRFNTRLPLIGLELLKLRRQVVAYQIRKNIDIESKRSDLCTVIWEH